MRVMVRLLPLMGQNPHKWGKNGDIDLAALAMKDFPIDAVIDYHSVVERKTAASACHASQGGMGLSMGRFRWLFKLLVPEKDFFMRAIPPPGGRREKDLFAGVNYFLRQNVDKYGGATWVKCAQEPGSGFSSLRIHSHRPSRMKP